MDISLIISFSWLKMNIHIAEIFLEGSLSQHIEIGLIIYVEEGILKKKKKNHKSFTVFVIKSKPRPKQKI